MARLVLVVHREANPPCLGLCNFFLQKQIILANAQGVAREVI